MVVDVIVLFDDVDVVSRGVVVVVVVDDIVIIINGLLVVFDDVLVVDDVGEVVGFEVVDVRGEGIVVEVIDGSDDFNVVGGREFSIPVDMQRLDW